MSLLLQACLLEGEAARRAWLSWSRTASDPARDIPPRLVPSLAYNLDKNGIDTELRVHFRAGLLREERRYARVREVLGQVLEVLPSPPLLVKGPALAETVYPTPALRHCHDLDLVVEELEPARNALARFDLLPHPSGLPVRLHQTLPDPPPFRLNLDTVRARSRAWGRARVPCPEDQLASILSLAFCHGLGEKNPTWVLDTVHLIRHHPGLDWSALPDTLPVQEMLARLHSLGFETPYRPRRKRPNRSERAFAGMPGSILDRLFPPGDYLAWKHPHDRPFNRRLHHLAARIPRPGPAATLPGPERTLLIRAAVSRSRQQAREAFRDWHRAHPAQPQDPFLRRLLPLLHDRLPAPENRPFQVFYRDKALKMRHLLELVPQVVETLRQHGIKAILLKGAALVSTCYGEPALRPMGDVDLLVRPFDRALTVLHQTGWRERQSALRHAATLEDEQGRVLDLHRFALRECRWAGVDDGLWERSQDGLPGRSDLFFHILAHGAKPGARGNPWPVDALLLLEQPVDWDVIVSESLKRGLTLPLRETLRYLAGELEAPVPDRILDRLDRAPVALIDHLYFRLRHRSGRLRRSTVFACLDHLRATRPGNPVQALLGCLSYLKKVRG